MALVDGKCKPVLADEGKVPRLDADLFRTKHSSADVSSANAVYGKAIRSSYASGAVTAGNTLVLRKTSIAAGTGTLDQSTAVLSIPLTDNGLLVVSGSGATALRFPTCAQLKTGAFGDARLASQPYVCWMFRIINVSDNTVTISVPGTETTLTAGQTGYNLVKVPAAPTTASQSACGVFVEIDNTQATPTCVYTLC